MGLALASDAKAVVIQDENRKNNVKTEFTSVGAAISHLVDADDDVDGMQYEGKIFAVLNSNGSAAWIVFDSETPLVTGEGGIITGSQNVIWNGNVGLWGNDDDIDVNGISFNPSTDRVNYSFYVLDADGTPVDEITDVTYDVDVYVNGQKVSSSVDDVEGTSNASGLVSGTLYVAAEADDVVEVVISNVSIAAAEEPEDETMTIRVYYRLNDDTILDSEIRAHQKDEDNDGFVEVNADMTRNKLAAYTIVGTDTDYVEFVAGGTGNVYFTVKTTESSLSAPTGVTIDSAEREITGDDDWENAQLIIRCTVADDQLSTLTAASLYDFEGLDIDEVVFYDNGTETVVGPSSSTTLKDLCEYYQINFFGLKNADGDLIAYVVIENL